MPRFSRELELARAGLPWIGFATLCSLSALLLLLVVVLLLVMMQNRKAPKSEFQKSKASGLKSLVGAIDSNDFLTEVFMAGESFKKALEKKPEDEEAPLAA